MLSAVGALEYRFPAMPPRVCAPNGKIRRQRHARFQGARDHAIIVPTRSWLLQPKTPGNCTQYTILFHLNGVGYGISDVYAVIRAARHMVSACSSMANDRNRLATYLSVLFLPQHSSAIGALPNPISHARLLRRCFTQVNGSSALH